MNSRPNKSGIDFKSLPDNALLRDRQFAGVVVPLTPCSIHRKVREGKFPPPIRLQDPKMTVWQWGHIRQWLDAQAQGGRA